MDRPEAAGARIDGLDLGAELRLKERAMDAAPVGITITDPHREDNPLVYVNDAFERVTGYPRAETVGRNCRFLQGDGSDAATVAEMRRAIEAGEATTVELLNYRRDGERFWNRVTLAPVRRDDGDVAHFVGFQEDVTARKEAELALAEEREHLAHLLERVEGLVGDVTRVLVGAGSRAEVEREVTGRFVAEPAYGAAWIGGADLAGDRVTPGTWAGEVEPEGLAVDLERTPDHPVARALASGGLAVAEGGEGLTRGERAWLAEAGLAGAAAVPLAYGDVSYGALCVYHREPGAVDEREAAVLEALGRAVATALHALETRRLLAGDETVEVEVAIRDDDLVPVRLAGATGAAWADEGSMAREDGSLVLFFSTDAAPEAIETVAAEVAGAASVVVLSTAGSTALVEVALPAGSALADLPARSARLRSLRAADGEARLVVELPSRARARAVVDRLTEAYPATAVIGVRERERPATTRAEFAAELEADLTERQRLALRTAYASGYYGPDRPATGDDLAASMGISRATFHQHRRAAERKLIGAVLEGPD